MAMTTTDTERALVSALLADPSRIPVVSTLLEPLDFGSDFLSGVYDTMLELSQQGRSVDVITLGHHGHDVRDLMLSGGGDAIEEYAEIIKDGAYRRKVNAHLDKLSRIVLTGDKPAIQSALLSMPAELSKTSKNGVLSPTDSIRKYRALMSERAVRGVGAPYGIPPLDRWLQPAHDGDMVIVAARPSMGKSVIAEHVADSWAFESEFPVLFASIEMSLGQLMDRAVSRWGGIPSSHIVRGVMSRDEETRANTALEARESVNLWYMDNPRATTDAVRGRAAEVAMRAGGLKGIVVDYLQLLNDKGDNDNQRVGKMSRNLKAIAREFSCPILVLSQLNRQSEMRKDPHPRLSDLRDSGAIEQDADVVIGVWRDREFGAEGDDMDLDVLKNRQGPLCRVTVPFDGEHVRLVLDD